MMLRNFVDIALFAVPIFVLYVKNIVSFLLLTSIYDSNQPWKFNHVYFAYFDFRNEPWTQCVCISFLNLYKEIRPGNLTTSYETTVIDHDFIDENIFTLLIFKRHTIRLLSLFEDDKNLEIR